MLKRLRDRIYMALLRAAGYDIWQETYRIQAETRAIRRETARINAAMDRGRIAKAYHDGFAAGARR